LHSRETEYLVAAALRFKNGALGTVHATTTAYPGFPERIEPGIRERARAWCERLGKTPIEVPDPQPERVAALTPG
jgi:hypothetical protein